MFYILSYLLWPKKRLPFAVLPRDALAFAKRGRPTMLWNSVCSPVIH